jgi:hypothetical protein
MRPSRAAAECDDPRILHVLLAAVATASALAQTGAHDTVTHTSHSAGTPTRSLRKAAPDSEAGADPRARPRRNRRQTGTAASTPRATAGSPTTKQPRQHDPTIANSPPRAPAQVRTNPSESAASLRSTTTQLEITAAAVACDPQNPALEPHCDAMEYCRESLAWNFWSLL